jgi:hypothetical protein
MASANVAALSSSPTSAHDLNLQRGPGPLHHCHGNRPVGSGADGLQDARVAECGDIAALLQLEADLIDAARCVDREHELQVGCLRHRRSGEGKHHEQSPPDGATDAGVPPVTVKASVHRCR